MLQQILMFTFVLRVNSNLELRFVLSRGGHWDFPSLVKFVYSPRGSDSTGSNNPALTMNTSSIEPLAQWCSTAATPGLYFKSGKNSLGSCKQQTISHKDQHGNIESLLSSSVNPLAGKRVLSYSRVTWRRLSLCHPVCEPTFCSNRSRRFCLAATGENKGSAAVTCEERDAN